MKKAPYCIQARNATAVNILRSWLNAVGIPNRPSTLEGFDLTLVKVSGEDMEICVALEGVQEAPGGVVVSAKDFTGKKVEAALAAFHAITRAAEYGAPSPLDRGAAPELNEQGNPRKLHYKEEDFLVTIRHNEFRRSPNPPEDRWAQYRQTMEKTAWSFLKINRELCERHAIDIDELLQYARCYVVNFCARYETPTPKFYDNERKCYNYLRQRFNSDLRAVLQKKERSMTPDAEVVRLALFNNPNSDLEVSPDPEDAYLAVIDNKGINEEEIIDSIMDEEENTDEDYVSRNCELDTSSPAARKASAGAVLQKLLSEMPHDEMIVILLETSKNSSFDFTTRKEAARQLRAHQGDCDRDSCQQVDVQEEAEIEKVLEEVPAFAEQLALVDSARLPQANRLGTIRTLVASIKAGRSDSHELSEACSFSTRQSTYYRKAANLLGLINDNGLVTESGRDLLTTEAGSQDEVEAFKNAINTSTLSVFSWFFDDESKNTSDLIKFVTGKYEASDVVVKRRVGTLACWRKQLSA